MTPAAPLVSVIMPCFNAAAYIEEAVGSVMAQTHPAIELIVVDDGSRDASPAIVEHLARQHPGRIRFVSQTNAGPYPARNHGLRLARGDYVAFLDADDWWEHEFIARMWSALAQDDDAALAYCGWRNHGAHLRSNDPFVPQDYEVQEKLELLMMGGSPWPIHAALTRRGIIDSVGGFRMDLDTSADFDLWMRIASRHKVIVVPEVLAHYRFHGGGQISSRPWLQAINGWRFKKRLLTELTDIDDVTRKRLLDIANQALMRRGYEYYWKRQLTSARHIFRFALKAGLARQGDLKHVLPSILPERIYCNLVKSFDRVQ
jgi:glycosyltransferase involved in cell wall biosynthesis